MVVGEAVTVVVALKPELTAEQFLFTPSRIVVSWETVTFCSPFAIMQL